MGRRWRARPSRNCRTDEIQQATPNRGGFCKKMSGFPQVSRVPLSILFSFVFTCAGLAVSRAGETEPSPLRTRLATSDKARPAIVGLSHIALFVHDLEKSRAFYKDFLGFAEPYSTTNKDGTLHLTWIKINDHQTVELFPEKEPSSDRLNHIAIETE